MSESIRSSRLTEGTGRNAGYASAVDDLLREFRENSWFVHNHWPLNEPHIRHMAADLTARLPLDGTASLLDVGCFNGYISYLFSRLGFRVTGADAADLDDRRSLFEREGIDFLTANFNHSAPFADVPDATYDAVILAQVIEHVLNHPLGLMRDLYRVTRPGGYLIVTTPHPANLMNVVRILRGGASLWGTTDFIAQPKFDGGSVISHPEIHYREYLTSEVAGMLSSAGYEPVVTRYLGLGAAEGQSLVKRTLKRSAPVQWLMGRRLLASNHYFLARRPVLEARERP